MTPARGSVYGGVLYLPDHPASDMHGLVRAVIRTRSEVYANRALERLGFLGTRPLWACKIWSESGSAIEKLITETHYGELLICPLVSAYLKAELYQPLERPSRDLVPTLRSSEPQNTPSSPVARSTPTT
jgi:hypothetical protein